MAAKTANVTARIQPNITGRSDSGKARDSCICIY